jgi:hypothetical protein
MTFKFANKWAYIELLSAMAMTWALYVGLQPSWLGWLLYSPLFIYLIFEGMLKVNYSLRIDDDNITVGSFKPIPYSISRITAMKVWEAKNRRIAVIAFADGRRFNFSDHLQGFDELIRLLNAKVSLHSATRT